MKMLNIVYIDDEKELCEVFEYSFGSSQIKIHAFSDPALAVKAVSDSKPDLVFLDYRLPGITGDELALRLPPEIPKFLISGDLLSTTKYPFVKIIAKPYQKQEIQAIIDAALARKLS